MQKDLAEKVFFECPFSLTTQCLFGAGCTKQLLPLLVFGQRSWRCFPASVIPYKVTKCQRHTVGWEAAGSEC